MRIKNTATRFGVVAIFLHWLVAILIIGLLALGLYMVRLPISLEKLKLYGWHKEFGLTVLFLAFCRLMWRLGNQLPELEALPLLEKLAARSMHVALYILMFAMPITGWLVTSSAGLTASFFGLFTLPDLVAPNESHRVFFAWAHEWLGYSLIAAISLHTAAALKHHFIDKDNILRRMLS